jgi:ribosomal protein S18 acetylase RimI-like enzyme
MRDPTNPDPLTIRRATLEDLPAIVRLLADDHLGRQRERAEEPLPAPYLAALAQIDRDPRHELVIGERGGRVVATLHLTFLPSLSFQGGLRAQIESVRVASDLRGEGLGQTLFAWAIARAREEGCVLVQLTTNASRGDAQRFYTRLGFTPSHVGMKLNLAE